jgi:hypothetical protein
MTAKELQIENGLWYVERVAKTHEGVAAVLARYHALEVEVTRLQELCDRLARAGMHEVDAHDLGY